MVLDPFLGYADLGPVSAAKHKKLLSMNFVALIKTGLPTKIPGDFQDKQTTAEYNVTSNMQQMEIWLVILFLSRKKFQAKQMFVLSSSTKFGPVLLGLHLTQAQRALSPKKGCGLVIATAKFALWACKMCATYRSVKMSV